MRYLFLLISLLLFSQSTVAQKIRLVGENLFLGTATGALLSTGSMAVKQEIDENAARLGVGFGILGGVGLSIYDIVQAQGEDDYFVEGLISSGHSSSKIIFMDTMIGGGLGVVVASAVSLIAQKNFVKSAGYGYSVGMWLGFGTGIADAFFFTESSDYPFYGDDDDFYSSAATPGTIDIAAPALTLTKTGINQYQPTFRLTSVSIHF